MTDVQTAPAAPFLATLAPPPLARRLLAEALGTGLLVTVVVGAGICARRLSPGDGGLELLETSFAVMLGLTVLILQFAPVSGAHFNPVVSLADWWLGHRRGRGLPGREVLAYTGAQTLGAVAGAVLANVMYDLTPFQICTYHRVTAGILLGEVVATAGLIAIVFSLARTGRASLSAPVVGAYIGAACWFTSSAAFANPAVTVGRIFSNTFTGIAPSPAAAFVAAQLVGGVFGVVAVQVLHPGPGMPAESVPVLP